MTKHHHKKIICQRLGIGGSSYDLGPILCSFTFFSSDSRDQGFHPVVCDEIELQRKGFQFSAR